MAVRNQWDKYSRKAGIGTYMLAGLLFILPKVGPLKLVAVKGPTESTEADYDRSIVASTADMRRVLARFTPPAARRASAARAVPASPEASQDVPRESRDPRHPLPNRDLDTGHVVQPGGYPLTDSTFANLLHVLTRQPRQPIPPGIKAEIQAYYANPDLPITTKKDPKRWAQVLADLATLNTMQTSQEPIPLATYDDNEGNDQEQK
jgi:hypothetical protein